MYRKLFHISEESSIDLFIPRASKSKWGGKRYVWAIEEKMIHNYLFPRACPRICVGSDLFNPLAQWIDINDTIGTKALVFVPEQWEEIINDCILYKYQFEPKNFKMIDPTAGYYVSEQKEKPLEVEQISNSLHLLESMHVAVSVQPSQAMKLIQEKVVQATNQFSIIKWENLDKD
ncbi:MAG: hypothetical protein KJP00_08420 [Bacteroidia bacterium]|nr:hypothetical protein [Bacteroidia bacterium]